MAGLTKVPGLCVIHTWSHVCHYDWNVQSSRIVCYTYLISCLSASLECPKFQDCVFIPAMMTNMRSGMYYNTQSWNFGHSSHADKHERIVCYNTYLISCLSLWLECLKFQDCVLYIPDLMFVIMTGMSKVPGLCVIHTWSHVCHRGCNVQSSRILWTFQSQWQTWDQVCLTLNPGTLDFPVTMTNMRSGICDWNVQSSRIVCYTYLISCLSLWLECPKYV
jgi:hypothetical protein